MWDFADKELVIFEFSSKTQCVYRGYFEFGQSISCRQFESLIDSLENFFALADSLISGVKTL